MEKGTEVRTACVNVRMCVCGFRWGEELRDMGRPGGRASEEQSVVTFKMGFGHPHPQTSPESGVSPGLLCRGSTRRQRQLSGFWLLRNVGDEVIGGCKG